MNLVLRSYLEERFAIVQSLLHVKWLVYTRISMNHVRTWRKYHFDEYELKIDERELVLMESVSSFKTLTSPNVELCPVVHCLLLMWLNYDVMYSMRHHFDLDDALGYRNTIPYCWFFGWEKLKQNFRNKIIEFHSFRWHDNVVTI